MNANPAIMLARLKAGLSRIRKKPIKQPLGIRIVWGVPERIKPIIGIPDHGRVRLRLREGKPAKVYHHTEDVVDKYYIEIDSHGEWIARRVGRNVTIREQTP